MHKISNCCPNLNITTHKKVGVRTLIWGGKKRWFWKARASIWIEEKKNGKMFWKQLLPPTLKSRTYKRAQAPNLAPFCFLHSFCFFLFSCFSFFSFFKFFLHHSVFEYLSRELGSRFFGNNKVNFCLFFHFLYFVLEKNSFLFFIYLWVSCDLCVFMCFYFSMFVFLFFSFLLIFMFFLVFFFNSWFLCFFF
jgi:hypothetical protein